MAIAKWSPFGDIESLFDRYQQALNRTLGSNEILKASDWTPAVDISESDEEYQIKMELPEIRKEDIKVHVDNGILTISGERRSAKEDKDKKHHRIERYYGSFSRSFTVPDDADENKIRAENRDGMLYLHLPKTAAPKTEKRNIEIG